MTQFLRGEAELHGERIHLKLHPAELRPPGELLLDRVTRAERHGDELPDEPFADGESIGPRLARDDDVILRLRFAVPRFTLQRRRR